ncbi:MAG TPA: YsnF/AvaK domain-containing protein [Allosphingosinicella sp.]
MPDCYAATSYLRRAEMTVEQEVAAIPLAEERVSITKREVETGRLRIQVSVEERQDAVPVELTHDEVEVERVPVNKAVSQLPSVRLEGSTTIIPVVEEVVVVEKRLILVEELHVRRKSVSETREIPVVLRSEQVRIDRAGDTGGADGAVGDVRAGGDA